MTNYNPSADRALMFALGAIFAMMIGSYTIWFQHRANQYMDCESQILESVKEHRPLSVADLDSAAEQCGGAM